MGLVNFIKKVWNNGDTVDAPQLNRIENGVNDCANALNNMEIGGRNILTNTNKGKLGWDIMKLNGITNLEDCDTIGAKVTCEQVSTGYSVVYFNIPKQQYDLLQPNSEYMLSFDVKTNMELGNCSVSIRSIGNGKFSSTEPYFRIQTDNNWHKVSIKLTTNDLTEPSTNQTIYFYGFNKIGETCFKNLKLEKGNMPTDWSPAPEDTQTQIDTINDNLTLKADIFTINPTLNFDICVVTPKKNSVTAQIQLITHPSNATIGVGVYKLGTLSSNDYDGITGVATGVGNTSSYGFFRVDGNIVYLNIVSTSYSAWFNGYGNISK